MKVELIGDSTAHDWFKRTDGMSVVFRGSLVDIYECRKCGITGKSYGLGKGPKRDHKYRAKKWEICPGSRIGIES